MTTVRSRSIRLIIVNRVTLCMRHSVRSWVRIMMRMIHMFRIHRRYSMYGSHSFFILL